MDENVCRDCGKSLASGLFGRGETRVLGSPYCEACVRARTLYCHTCRVSLKAEDFAEGRAVTLLGRRFCENCLESEVKKGRERAASDPSHQAVRASSGSKPPLVEDSQDVDTLAIRRLYGRYVPHSDAVLSVKSGGLLGNLLGNRVKLWLDVSEGGFRAIIQGKFKDDDVLSGSITFKPKKRAYPFQATVQYVRPSQRYPGCVLIGAKFEKPTQDLQAFITGKMSGRPVIIPPSQPRPRSKPASTSFPPPSLTLR